MAGFWTAAAVISAAAISAGASMYSANKQAKAQREASDKQMQLAREQEAQKRQEFKKMNQSEVDISGLMQGNRGSQLGSTMLTGAGGVDPRQLNLGGNSLLGG